MERFKKIKEMVSALEADADKFYTSNVAAAGTRLRKGMQELKNIAQEIRTEVTDLKNKVK